MCFWNASRALSYNFLCCLSFVFWRRWRPVRDGHVSTLSGLLWWASFGVMPFGILLDQQAFFYYFFCWNQKRARWPCVCLSTSFLPLIIGVELSERSMVAAGMFKCCSREQVMWAAVVFFNVHMLLCIFFFKMNNVKQWNGRVSFF